MTTAVNDRLLVEALRRGEASAVEALVERCGAWIHRVANRLLDDPRDAEEVTQDVLLTIVRQVETFRGESAFSTWVYRIAVNAAYGRLRSRRSRAEVSLEAFLPVFDATGRHPAPVMDWSGHLEDPAAASEVREAIERAIGRLPDDYRTVLVLRDVEGLSNEQVAGALDLSIAAVKSRLHRGRLALRQQLADLFSPSR